MFVCKFNNAHNIVKSIPNLSECQRGKRYKIKQIHIRLVRPVSNGILYTIHFFYRNFGAFRRLIKRVEKCQAFIFVITVGRHNIHEQFFSHAPPLEYIIKYSIMNKNSIRTVSWPGQ